MKNPNFYALIIGSEILNGRREDRHFKFLQNILKESNLKFSGSFIIEDKIELIASTIKYLSMLPNSVIFSFGGIGSTPDDYTREAASIAIRDGRLYTNKEFKLKIEKRIKGSSNRHPLNMANLPLDSKLLPNELNGMYGFSLEDRFFFMPGFPEMSHQMVKYVLKKYFSNSGKREYRYTLTALCKESEFIELMQESHEEVDVSSLPKIYKDSSQTTISVLSFNDNLAKNEFKKYIDFVNKYNIRYTIGEGYTR